MANDNWMKEWTVTSSVKFLDTGEVIDYNELTTEEKQELSEKWTEKILAATGYEVVN